MADTTQYKVVINPDRQYSIVPLNEPTTRLWRDAGMAGTKQQCLNYIEEVWTDMKSSDLLNLKSKLGLR